MQSELMPCAILSGSVANNNLWPRTYGCMNSVPQTAASTLSASKQLAGFIATFEPATAKLIRQCRAEVCKLLPTALEIVYDNDNFFVIGYSATERPSDCILSLAAGGQWGRPLFLLRCVVHISLLRRQEKTASGARRSRRWAWGAPPKKRSVTERYIFLRRGC
jgi:hypothetical protein